MPVTDEGVLQRFSSGLQKTPKVIVALQPESQEHLERQPAGTLVKDYY